LKTGKHVKRNRQKLMIETADAAGNLNFRTKISNNGTLAVGGHNDGSGDEFDGKWIGGQW
jgi:hypothetical protein